MRPETPYLSQSKYLVLVYTVTNKAGEDIKISRQQNAMILAANTESVSVFLKLKKPGSYQEVSESDSFLI